MIIHTIHKSYEADVEKIKLQNVIFRKHLELQHSYNTNQKHSTLKETYLHAELHY
jgi:hypothetical protein